MAECCYECGLMFLPGDEFCELIDEHGDDFKVHAECMNNYESADEEAADEGH